ncbi:MAG: hypothetical protein BGN87_23290 [Rhizobiales bacterium 65-79]|nr:cysteine hydrolase [Hyphomicrobiales bacterium]OJU01379.1 MAG: hypothetical protein BGN87_23290 [Rhizobiales bacterium 65-79]
MHKRQESAAISSRIISRRGKFRVFDKIDPRRTALVVIDMQNGYMHPGQPAEISTAREIVPNINKLSQAFRSAGATVVFTLNTIDAQAHAEWSNYFNNFWNEAARMRMRDSFEPDKFGHQLWPSLDVSPQDFKFTKNRFSAFFPGASDLPDFLAGRGIDTVVIVGTATNICCECSARDAMMLNYKVIVVSDATATYTDEEHNSSLDSMRHLFADVLTTEQILRDLGDN